MVPRFWDVALFALLFATGSVAQPAGLRDDLNGNWSITEFDDAVLADLSGYYQIHSNVRLGPERRLENGVAGAS